MGRELDKYLETLYNERAGYVYVAVKQTGNFLQQFYEYPQQRSDIIASILNSVILGEVYVCPSLFATEKATKDQCLGSSVAWVDFDGNYPQTWPSEVPQPSMVVQTSSERNVHAYWKLDAFLPASEIEEVNRKLSYFFAADISGWDANQLLRPPETRNHKRGKQVGLTTGSGETYSLAHFTSLPSPPALPKDISKLQIPSIEEAHANINWPANLRALFENGLPDGRRHQGMFALAAGLAELNIPPRFILSVLLYSDNNAFHKFQGRPDQLTRLLELVTRAVSKAQQKAGQSPKESKKWIPKTVDDILTAEWKLEWLLKPYIHKTTCGVLSGPPGVGKSLMCLSLAQILVLGGDFIGVTPSKTLRVGFLSLEMDTFELHEALKLQVEHYTPEQRALLRENFPILDLGEPQFFNDKEVERLLLEFVGDNHLNGLFVDSLSSTTPGDLSSEKETKFIFELDAKLRSKFTCFTFYIHHNRKAQADNKRPNKLADLHGSVHIQSKPSTILTLWPLDPKNERVAFKPLKLRSHKLGEDTVVSRDDNLHYKINKNSAGSQATSFIVQEKKGGGNDIGSNNQDSFGNGSGMPGTLGDNKEGF